MRHWSGTGGHGVIRKAAYEILTVRLNVTEREAASLLAAANASPGQWKEQDGTQVKTENGRYWVKTR